MFFIDGQKERKPLPAPSFILATLAEVGLFCATDIESVLREK